MTQLVVFLLINRLVAMGQGEAVPWKPRETVFLNLRVSAVTQTGHSDDVQEGEAAPTCDTGGGRGGRPTPAQRRAPSADPTNARVLRDNVSGPVRPPQQTPRTQEHGGSEKNPGWKLRPPERSP